MFKSYFQDKEVKRCEVSTGHNKLNWSKIQIKM